MIDKGQWGGFGQDTGVTPLLFTRSSMGFLMTTESQDLGLMSYPKDVPVLAWPAYSPDMSPIEYVWDALDRRIRQSVLVPANIQQLRTAIKEEWTNIPQATINNLINSMQRRCVDCVVRGKWWSHQILTGFWTRPDIPPPLPPSIQ